jgi:hypothetical protein
MTSSAVRVSSGRSLVAAAIKGQRCANVLTAVKPRGKGLRTLGYALH